MFRPKGGFTLVELLVVIAVMATMVSVCVVSVRAGQDAARVRGAARNVFVEGATLAENAGRLLSAWPPIGTTR
jgi:prepilin-type N-terminal cleavage/methylation domain-containing protein